MGRARRPSGRRTNGQRRDVILFRRWNISGACRPRHPLFLLAAPGRPVRAACPFAILLFAICIALALPGALHAAPAGPHFADEGRLSTNSGHMMIAWEADGPVTLEMARSDDFADAERVYSGSNGAYFLSGLNDGDYYLRLRQDGGAVSETLLLDVEHSSLSLALWLMAAGLIVSIGIVVTILRGARDG